MKISTARFFVLSVFKMNQQFLHVATSFYSIKPTVLLLLLSSFQSKVSSVSTRSLIHDKLHSFVQAGFTSFFYFFRLFFIFLLFFFAAPHRLCMLSTEREQKKKKVHLWRKKISMPLSTPRFLESLIVRSFSGRV